MAARKPAPKPEPVTPAPAGDDFDALLGAQTPPPEKSTAERDVPPPTSDDPTEGIDDLLAGVNTPAVETIPELTPAQARLAQARAEAVRLAKAKEDALRPAEPEDPNEGLTADEIRELELLTEANSAAAQELVEKVPAKIDNSHIGGNGEHIIFNVVHSGFTAFGEVWLRGQEFDIEVGTEAYKRTVNALGQTWLDIIDDPRAQMQRWGRHYLSPGAFVPYPGENFDDEVARSDKRRGRQVPIVTSFA